MKLRTKLALITGGVVLLATLLGAGLTLSTSRRAVLDQVSRSAYSESESIFQGVDAFLSGMKEGVRAYAVVYYLKERGDDYTILLQDGRVLYNRTILNPDELAIRTGERDRSEAGLYYGRRLLAYSMNTAYNFTLIHVVDVTEAYLGLRRLALQLAAISLLIVGASSLTVLLLARRALRPMKALSEGANSIAQGAYDQRVPEGRGDEIGGLGRDFNRMAEAVQEHIRRVEESEEQKTLFMASLTHELKTPLTAISGYAQTLRRAKLSEEDRDLALEYIASESLRLDRLSKKMLRLLELNRDIPLLMEPVPIAALTEDACRTCLPAAKEKGVEIVPGVCKGCWTGDKDLLTEAVINLIDNGVKASSAGGQVRVYTQDQALVVEDRGCGIPEGETAHLTEAFYMVDKSRSRASGGAGMGLALTAAILRRHHMGVRFESRVGEGTRVFVFTF